MSYVGCFFTAVNVLKLLKLISDARLCLTILK